MSARIPTGLRAQVHQRAGGRCEYCRVHESDVLFPHEPDHIIAEQHGGATTTDNLALACFHCNRQKGPNIASVDPETGQIEPLFNPRTDRWETHFRFEGTRIVPLTAAGRATVLLLKLNSSERIRVRTSLREAGRLPG